MDYVYLLITGSGHIFGVYKEQALAAKFFDMLSREFPDSGLRLEKEIVLTAAAYYPMNKGE